mmetsp:Transcript_7819/g.21970  ORF Transcript_7819/g.21970 Transcript_7819/m.21970 type:complete len:201 (+) Transcript_7819:395-997(+)
MHHARLKSTKSTSTTMTCSHAGSTAARNPIMSSNLFISHAMLLPSAVRGGVSLKYFFLPQLHVGWSWPVTGSTLPDGFAPQMLSCCETENAQTQYVVSSFPESFSQVSISSMSTSRRAATILYSSSCKASAMMPATRSRNRLPQLCVTILFGLVGTCPIMISAYAHLWLLLNGMIAWRTTSSVVWTEGSKCSMYFDPRPR